MLFIILILRYFISVGTGNTECHAFIHWFAELVTPFVVTCCAVLLSTVQHCVGELAAAGGFSRSRSPGC